MALTPGVASAAGAEPTTTSVTLSDVTHAAQPVTITATIRSTGAPLTGQVFLRNAFGLDHGWDPQLGLLPAQTCPGTSSTCTVSVTAKTLLPDPVTNRIVARYLGDDVNAVSEAVVEVTGIRWGTTTPRVTQRAATTVYGEPIVLDASLALDPPSQWDYPGDLYGWFGRRTATAVDEATGTKAEGSGTRNPTTIRFDRLPAGTRRIAVTWHDWSLHPRPVKDPEAPVVVEHVVRKASTRLALDADVSGSDARLTARLTTIAPGAGTGTGDVVFTKGDDATEAIGRAEVGADGIAATAVTLPPGEHVIRAWYGGDANFEPSSMERVVRIEGRPSPDAGAPAAELVAVTAKPGGVIVTKLRCTKGTVTVKATRKGELYAPRRTKRCVGHQRIT